MTIKVSLCSQLLVLAESSALSTFPRSPLRTGAAAVKQDYRKDSGSGVNKKVIPRKVPKA